MYIDVVLVWFLKILYLIYGKCLCFFILLFFRKNKIGLFYCVELIFFLIIFDYEGYDKLIKRIDMKYIKVICELRLFVFCLMFFLVEFLEMVDIVCFFLLIIFFCVFYYRYKLLEEVEFCIFGNVRYIE